MVKTLDVWHTKFGQGVIISEFSTSYEIKFDIGTKEIAHSYWLKCLFLCEEDALIKDQIILKDKYKKYLKLIEPKNDIRFVNSGVLVIPNELEIIDEPENLYEQKLEEKFILHDLEERNVRNMVILSNRTIDTKNKQYLQIIALDIFTGKIVYIVDTNGMCLGLHNFDLEMSKLKEFSVIQASFKIGSNDNNKLNVLRITSKYKNIGQSDLTKLKEKYRDVFNYEIERDFKTIFKFAEENNKSFCTIAKFTGSKVKGTKNKNGITKYQIKMQEHFVDIFDNGIGIHKKEGLSFVGLALLSIEYLVGGGL